MYDKLIGPMQAGVRRIALDLVPPQADWQVLDVGCGTGTGMVPYVEAGCSVSGVDVSPAMIENSPFGICSRTGGMPCCRCPAEPG